MGVPRLARAGNPAHRVWHHRVSSLVSSSIERSHNDLHARGVRWRSVGGGRFRLDPSWITGSKGNLGAPLRS